MKTSVPLLIASDNPEDIEEIGLVLMPNFTRRGTATDVAAGSEFIMGREFCVIGLSFRSLDAAQNFYTDMLRRAIHNRPLSHRTMLLCGSGAARDACTAVMRGRFDDFVMIKPLADPCLLRFRAYRLARSLETEDRIRRTVGEQHLARSRRITDRALASMDREQRRLAAQTEEDQRQLRNRINRHITDFEQRLASPEFAGAVEVLDKGRLNARVQQGVYSDLERELAAFKDKISSALDDVLQRYQRVRQEADSSLDGMADSGEKLPLSIMVVDDDPEMNDTVRELLEMDDHQVLQAFDGDSGYFAAVQNTPDLLLIDVNLPKLNGIDLSRKLKAHIKTRHIPIVIITGNATRSVVEAGRRIGVREFLVKPFGYETLRDKVKKVMGATDTG